MGKKNPLKELMALPPEADDTSYIFQQIDGASDHAAALLTCELMSYAIQKCIIRELTISNKSIVTELFGHHGVLGNFASKIVMGHALGCFGPAVHEELERFRNVRNAFAHAPSKLDFNTPKIRTECLKLQVYKRLRGPHAGRYDASIDAIAKLKPAQLARHLFVTAATMLGVALLKDADRAATEPSRFDDVLDLPN